jgi:serine/threonine-protein kinase
MSPQPLIAHYRITSKLGEGGMGAVYRATDTKLNRDVAIKILPESVAQDADRMARFTREARVLASLNHPNVAAIYGVEERALILELVEGPTLAERIAQGPIPLEEGLPIAKHIAEALEYAYERGVIHRDLKPANIKITPEGRVKVLDFGLAKAMSADTTSGDPASSPTLTMRDTQMGMIIGTAAYMSPEQAKGKPVDRRADIWAFGVVLYEMLTGRQLYGGETVSETLASVIKDTPDLTALPGPTPPSIRGLLHRCLEKEPRRRLRDIGEARFTLEEPQGDARSTSAAPRTQHRLLTVLSAAALAGAAVAIVHFREVPTQVPVARLEISLPEKTHLSTGSRLAVSPDGRKLAFNAVGAGGRYQLWVRPLDSLEARPLAGTEEAEPRGLLVAAGEQEGIRRIFAVGRPYRPLKEGSQRRNPDWGCKLGSPKSWTEGRPRGGAASLPFSSFEGKKPGWLPPQVLCCSAPAAALIFESLSKPEAT